MTAPPIPPVAPGEPRPLWSVMIPTFNCANYLGATLRSVLQQDRGPDEMHIEVVDDASTGDDPEAIVRQVGGGRVAFHRKPRNEGAIANFNTCLSRSRGQLVHVLHGDDLVSDGFYTAIERLAADHPGVGLYATRCFFIDEDAVITAVSKRLPSLETPSHLTEPFFNGTPLQFAGVAVRRSAYERLGGFRADLVHTADREMWARVVHACGAVVSREVLASYRIFAANDSARLTRTAENIRDLRRLSAVFAARFPDFRPRDAAREASKLAWKQYRRFEKLGDRTAAQANYEAWQGVTNPVEQAVQRLRAVRALIRRRMG